ncbi:MAG TPA: glycosyltransferase family 2 protein [bacterium]|nr:glycosyltransferase family 2 protein [bacterium]
MTPLPSLGLGVITYRSLPTIDRCLESVLAAAAQVDTFEGVVVDNNSPDDTARHLDEHWADRFRLVLRDDNLGYAVAVNSVARVARGDIIGIVNPDTELDPEALRLGLAFLRDRPEVGVLGGNLHGGGRGAICFGNLPTPWRFYYTNAGLRRVIPVTAWRTGLDMPPDAKDPFPVGYPCGAFLLIRRAAWEEVGPFDERFFLYFEETDWATRCHRTKWQAWVHPGVRVRHKGGASTGSDEASQITMFTRFYRSGFMYLAKHYGVPTARRVYRQLRSTSHLKQKLLALPLPADIRAAQRITHPALEATAEFVFSDQLSGNPALVLRPPHPAEAVALQHYPRKRP